jgi:hypothetical protein
MCQSQHLSQLNSQKSSILWISRVQRKIWHIAWDLWEHRNNYLHNQGTTIHAYEMSALNSETQHEWQTGLDQLLPSYQYLFDGTIIKPLSDSINQKLMWLLSIWAARDNEIHIGTMR